MDVQDLYARALAAIDERRWADAQELLEQVQALDADYRDSAQLLALARQLAGAELEITERRAAGQPTPRDEEQTSDAQPRGPAWLPLVLFMAALGLVATLINFLLH
jgi:hypothetical protein